MKTHLAYNISAYILKRFLLHLTIVVFYLGLTALEFVVVHNASSPNPIGVGFQQLICMIIHILSTLLREYKNTRIPNAKSINFFIVLAIIILYAILTNWIWNWLWSLR